MSHVFPPLVAGGAVRMGQFARLLPEFGWDVSVLTGKHDTAIDREAAAAIASRTHVVEAWSPISGVVTRGKPKPKRGLAGALHRVVRVGAHSIVFPDREIFWVPGAIETGRKLLRQMRHDVVIATHGPPSNLLVGRSLASSFELPLIVDFRDLWATLPMPIFSTRIHRAAARRLERSIVRSATRVIAVSPGMARELATAHGISTDHTVSITNGFDPVDAARVHDVRGPEPRPFRLVYTGAVHIHYDFEPFWRALRALADAGTIRPETFRVEFVGNLVDADARSHGLEAFVETRPFVPHAEVFEAFARADALLLVETPGYYARMSYAAKVFDYILTGKPVVGLVESGGNSWRLLNAAGVAHCVEPHDESGLRAVLARLLALKGAPPRHVDVDAPPFRDFNRRHLVAKLAAMLHGAVSHPGNR